MKNSCLGQSRLVIGAGVICLFVYSMDAMASGSKPVKQITCTLRVPLLHPMQDTESYTASDETEELARVQVLKACQDDLGYWVPRACAEYASKDEAVSCVSSSTQ